jgi:superfamily II DNA/RNA helicase
MSSTASKRAADDLPEEDEGFVPLRKVLKRKSTGKEDNFMSSYYTEAEEISALSPEEVARIRLELDIQVEGENCPNPIQHFAQLPLPPGVLERLYARGLFLPTPVQMQVLPAVMQGRDVIGLAETGSGKTLAYLLPLLVLLTRFEPARGGEGPLALIVVPTRELVEQVYSELAYYLEALRLQRADGRGFQALGVVGGVRVDSQTPALARGVDVLLATPGRLLDLTQRGAVSFERLAYLVLDEVDELLKSDARAQDEPMEAQLRRVLGHMNLTARQTLLFSATFPDSVQRLARSAVLAPLTIIVGGQARPARTLRQNVRVLASHSEKRAALLELLRSTERPPVLIFCNSQATVDRVVADLRQEQFHVAGLHGQKSQAYRFRVMQAFKQGRLDVLVATDLDSRGIDVRDITHVILYDMPDRIEQYIHRAGRTGRAGHCGLVSTLLTPDCKCAKELRQLLEQSGEEVPAELHNLKLFERRERADSHMDLDG